jgi:acyl-CoA hydrolase
VSSETKKEVRVQDTHLKLAQIMTPTDANVLGKVFGGSILSMIDLTASATAQKFAGRVCVTASFERVDFHTPIDVGALVTMRGHVSYAGRTSVEVTIDVTATDLPTGRDTHTNTARVIMVAVDKGRPVPVPTLICETREERIAFVSGRLRRELRAERIAQFDGLVAQIQAMDEATLTELQTCEGRLMDRLQA